MRVNWVHDGEPGRAGRPNARDAGPIRRLPAGREHPLCGDRALDDRDAPLGPRFHPLDERDRPHVVALAGDLVPPGDADLLLRRWVLEPRRVRRLSGAGREHRGVHPEPARAIAAPVARVPRRVDRRAGDAAHRRHRRDGGTAAVGRHATPARHAPAGGDDPVRTALVPARLRRGRLHLTVDDRPASAVRAVGAGGDGPRHDRGRLGRVHGRPSARAMGQRRVRAAVPAPAGSRLRRREHAALAPHGVLGDDRRWVSPG